MRRIIRLLCLGSALALASLGSVSWLFHKGPLCADIQRELLSRVKALMSMHILKDPPEVELIQSCGVRYLPDSIFFDLKKAFHYLQLKPELLPLTWQDLRLMTSKEISAHPSLGESRWVIRFDKGFDRSTRTTLLSVLRHYLEEEGRPLVIDLKRPKTDLPGTETGQAKDQFPLRPFTELEVPAPKPLTPKAFKSPIDLELAQQLFLYLSMLLLGILLVKTTWKRLLSLLDVEKKAQTSEHALQLKKEAAEQAAALFGPYFVAAWRDRAGDLIRSLVEADSIEMPARVRRWILQDPEAMHWALLAGDENFRRSILPHLSAEQLMVLNDFAKDSSKIGTQTEARALGRFLLELGRELGCSLRMDKFPRAIQLLTTDEWQSLVPQLSRNRRRVLARRLGGRRAVALQVRSFEWGSPSSSEESEDLICQKITTILGQKLSELHDCLGSDAEFKNCLTNFFSDLIPDKQASEDLSLVFLAGAEMQRRTFASSVLLGDQRVAMALEQMDNELVAVTLFDCEKTTQERALSLLPTRTEGIVASLRRLEYDRIQQKKWKMRSKAHQRFFERQVLIAELFTSTMSQNKTSA